MNRSVPIHRFPASSHFPWAYAVSPLFFRASSAPSNSLATPGWPGLSCQAPEKSSRARSYLSSRSAVIPSANNLSATGIVGGFWTGAGETAGAAGAGGTAGAAGAAGGTPGGFAAGEMVCGFAGGVVREVFDCPAHPGKVVARRADRRRIGGRVLR